MIDRDKLAKGDEILKQMTSSSYAENIKSSADPEYLKPFRPYSLEEPVETCQSNRTEIVYPDVVTNRTAARNSKLIDVEELKPLLDFNLTGQLLKNSCSWEVNLYVKYVRDGMKPLEYIGGEKSDWVDLRSGIDVKLKAMERCNIPLGVAIKLPHGFEAHIEARSSTYKNFKIIRINSGVIDNAYCGNDDEWHFEALALEDTEIHKNDRICQFRIVENQPRIRFVTVDNLPFNNRGGNGTTGYK